MISHNEKQRKKLIGYSRYLQKIKEFLLQSLRIGQTSNKNKHKTRILLITGKAGVGKTAIIHELQHQNQNQNQNDIKFAYQISLFNVLNLIVSTRFKQQTVTETITDAIKLGARIIVLDEFEMLHDQVILEPVLKIIRDKDNRDVVFVLVTNCKEKLAEQYWPVITYEINIENPDTKQKAQILAYLCQNENKSQNFAKEINYLYLAQTIPSEATPADLITLVRDCQMKKVKKLMEGHSELSLDELGKLEPEPVTQSDLLEAICKRYSKQKNQQKEKEKFKE